MRAALHVLERHELGWIDDYLYSALFSRLRAVPPFPNCFLICLFLFVIYLFSLKLGNSLGYCLDTSAESMVKGANLILRRCEKVSKKVFDICFYMLQPYLFYKMATVRFALDDCNTKLWTSEPSLVYTISVRRWV
jgi:hypothetical protein